MGTGAVEPQQVTLWALVDIIQGGFSWEWRSGMSVGRIQASEMWIIAVNVTPSTPPPCAVRPEDTWVVAGLEESWGHLHLGD